MFLSYLALKQIITNIILKMTYFIFLVISPALMWGVAYLYFHCCSTAVLQAEKHTPPLSKLVQKFMPASEHPSFTYTDTRKHTPNYPDLAYAFFICNTGK